LTDVFLLANKLKANQVKSIMKNKNYLLIVISWMGFLTACGNSGDNPATGTQDTSFNIGTNPSTGEVDTGVNGTNGNVPHTPDTNNNRPTTGTTQNDTLNKQ
jgi:hypothetical protein